MVCLDVIVLTCRAFVLQCGTREKQGSGNRKAEGASCLIEVVRSFHRSLLRLDEDIADTRYYDAVNSPVCVHRALCPVLLRALFSRTELQEVRCLELLLQSIESFTLLILSRPARSFEGVARAAGPPSPVGRCGAQ